MNELIIMWLLAILAVGAIIIGTPIAYIAYRFNGGEYNFWNWLIYEV